jgi:hypothetical protein
MGGTSSTPYYNNPVLGALGGAQIGSDIQNGLLSNKPKTNQGT